MSTRSIITAVFLITIGIIIGVVLVSNFKGVGLSYAREDVKLGSDQPPLQSNATLQALNEAYHEISKAVNPAVVYIQVEMESKSGQEDASDFFFRFFGPDFKFDMPKKAPEIGTGSGVIIKSDGYILTNNHVVANAKKDGIKVQLSDTREFKAKLIGTDKYTDLAVVKIDAENLPVASFGNSDEVEVGHIVFAFGAPLGLKSTMTHGIVSALGRNLGIIGDEYGIENFIQTDAPVNPGNSGGPLVNVTGQVIGINTAIATTNARYQGHSFAIPINLAKKVAMDLIKYGKFKRGFLGIQIKLVDAVTAKAAGLDKPKGVWVESVNKESPAEKAGIQYGDIILSVDGKEVNTPQALQTAIASKHPGTEVVLQIWRDKKVIDKKVTLGSRDEDSGTISERTEEGKSKSNAENIEKTVEIKNLGITVAQIDSKTKQKYEVDKGVIIREVEPLSPAYERGLRKGDVIVDVDNQTVTSPSHLEKIIGKLKPGDAVMFRVKGEDKRMRLVPIEIPQ